MSEINLRGSVTKRTPWPVALFALALVLAFAPGCSHEASPPLRIGINPWPGYEFLYLAQEKGLFKAAGVEVRLVEYNSLADSRRAYERGQLDGMACTVVELILSRHTSPRSPQAVLMVDYSEGADVILSRPFIKGMKDLKGRRVGVEMGSLGIYILHRALEKAGLRLEDVVLVSSDQMLMEAAFTKGEVDAVVTYPPVSNKLMEKVGTRKVFSSAEIPGEVADVLVVEAGVVNARSQEVERLLRAFHQAQEFARKDPAEAHRIMGAREGISPSEFKATLEGGLKLVPANEQSGFLGRDGKLAAVMVNCEQALRATKQISGPGRAGDASVLLPASLVQGDP